MQNIGHINIGFVDTNFFFLTLIISLQVSKRQNQAFGGGPHSIRYVILSLSFMEFDSFFVVAVDSNSPIQKPFFFFGCCCWFGDINVGFMPSELCLCYELCNQISRK